MEQVLSVTKVRLVRGVNRLTVAIFIGCLSASSAGADVLQTKPAMSDAQLQQLFQMGGIALSQGDYRSAAEIFQAFLAYSESPRVELELARALFLAGDYHRAYDVFERVLDSGRLPWQVKQPVYRYLREIDQAVGFFDLSLAWVSDDNPKNFTTESQVTILGQTFQINQPDTAGAAQGVQYRLSAGMPITDNALTQLYSHLVIRDLEHRYHDSYTWDVGAYHRFENFRQWRLQTGLEQRWETHQLQYRYPYLHVQYTPNVIQPFQQRYTATLAYLDMASNSYQDSTRYAFAADYMLPVGSTAQILTQGMLMVADAEDDAESFHQWHLQASLNVPVDSWSLEAGGSLTQTNYQADDPFFGERRKDQKQRWFVTFLNQEWDWWGLTPVLGVSYERVDSSLAYYTYDKVMISAELRSYR